MRMSIDVGALTDQVVGVIREDMADEYERLSSVAKVQIAGTAAELSHLLLRQAGGEDVAEELLHVKAAMANWTFVEASRVRSAMAESFRKVMVGIVGVVVSALI